MSTIKESRDELNPPVGVPANEIVPLKQRRTIGDYVALAIATCGVGYFPIAPGTFGSLVGVGIYLILRREITEAYFYLVVHKNRYGSIADAQADVSFVLIAILLLSIAGLSIVGIWAASRAERLFGRKDPGPVVIDEVVGQLMTYSFVSFLISPVGVLVGFILFRAFDILKPYPIRRLEVLKGGLGIVADDILAGLYAGTILAVINALRLLRLF